MRVGPFGMMIGMDGEVISGLIGFGGAVVGGAAAIGGTWLQQKHQTKMAREQRETARQDAAFDMAVQAVFTAQDLFRNRWDGRRPEPDWDERVHAEASRLRLASLSIQDSDIRQLLEQVALMLTYWEHTVPRDAQSGEKFRAIEKVTQHSQEALGQYLRDGIVPEVSAEYKDAWVELEDWIEEMEAWEEHERGNQL
ncbi:hypothetical protein [Streptomyces sp. NPDC096012]|uniref:hypothetical protein n=1 Tax=Streptomyces sp. NPDC096012 TaxID=3155684 RepID=UPI003369D174